MKRYNIAFCNRPSYDKPLGGDAIQMLKTKEYLEKNYDLSIDILTDASQISDKYDLVHIFNYATFEISATFFNQAKSLNIPIASSSIYWDYSYACTYIFRKWFGYPNYISERRINIERKLVKLLSQLSRPRLLSPIFKNYLRDFIQKSDIILPNSIEEAELLLNFAGMDNEQTRKKVHIVYNAVDPVYSQNNELSKNDFLKKYAIPENYILQVGRIEYLKNQLNLIYSLKDYPHIPIVIVGKCVDNAYMKKLVELSNKRGNVYFFANGVEHNEIHLFYKYAALHTLLSFRESPGLVSMEALLQGCPIVTSSAAFTPCKTYFADNIYTVSPFDITAITNTILDAYTHRNLATLDLEKFSWENVAKQTYDYYMKILR